MTFRSLIVILLLAFFQNKLPESTDAFGGRCTNITDFKTSELYEVNRKTKKDNNN
jgi:hypothetical protein